MNFRSSLFPLVSMTKSDSAKGGHLPLEFNRPQKQAVRNFEEEDG
jgi:hypothetical protein